MFELMRELPIFRGFADANLARLVSQVREQQLCVTIRDRGRPFDPHDAPPPDLGHDLDARAVGGLGLFLVTELSDRLIYRHDPASGWNELVVLKDAEGGDV